MSSQYPPQWRPLPSQQLPPQSPSAQWQPPNTGSQFRPPWPPQQQGQPQPPNTQSGPLWPPQQQGQPMPPGMYPPPQQQQPIQPIQSMPGMDSPQSPKKRGNRGLLIVAIVVVVLLVAGGGIFAVVSNATKRAQNTNNTTLNTATSTVATTSSPKGQATTVQGTWTTTHTFIGNGSKKTATFTIGNNWRIAYSCNGLIVGVATDGILVVAVYGSNNHVVDPSAVNTTCKSGTALTKGASKTLQGGQVYLSIVGLGNWTLAVQELK